jgi:GTPase SAR1 family protein
MQEKLTLTLKISFNGESGVGKTAFIGREVISVFLEHRQATIGVDIKKKQYFLGLNMVNVQFWHLDGGT